MTLTQVKQQALALSPIQRIRLVQDLWDSVIDKAQSAPVPLHHKRLIDQRLAAHEADPSGTISLAEAKRRVNKILQQRRTVQ